MLLGRDNFVWPTTCTEESYGCLSVLSVECCHVEVCAKG